MKYRLIFILVISMALQVSAQDMTYNCPDIINNQTLEEAFITFSGVTCNNMGNTDPMDDVITFRVSGENGNSSQAISGFPVFPPTVSNMNTLNIDAMNQEVQIWAGSSPFNEQISAISPGCAPLNLTLNWGQFATNCPSESVILAPAAAPIPTLGQWAIIILGFIFIVAAVVAIKTPQYSIG